MITMNDNWFVAVIAAVVTGILYALSLDIGPFGPLALIAPIPLLLFALTSGRTVRVAAAAFIARIVSFSGIFIAYGGTLPLAALAAMAVIFALAFTASILVTRWCAHRLPTWLAVFCFPVFATAIEFVLLMGSPHGTFGAMGYSLVSILPLAQFASIGGVAGLTFIVALVPMCIAMLLHRPRNWRETVLAGALPMVLILAFGFWRLSLPYQTSVHVGLGAIDELTMRALKSPAEAADVAGRYAWLGGSIRPGELDFIVFPERVFSDAQDQMGHGSAPLQSLARASGATVIAGFDEKLADGRHANTARIFLPQGGSMTYTKRRLVPGLESELIPGSQSLVMSSVGVAICKDMDFASMIREYGQRDVSLMLVPAWDFKIDGRAHSRMAMVRSIENGFAMVRAAATGRLTVNDAYGRIVAEQDSSGSPQSWLMASVGLSTNIPTLYTKIGESFAWLSIAGSILLLFMAWRLRRRALAQPTDRVTT
jgi:apolipoprotein N-acyltransferase